MPLPVRVVRVFLYVSAGLTFAVAVQAWILTGGARGAGAALFFAVPAVACALAAWRSARAGRWSWWTVVALEVFYLVWQLGRLPAGDPSGLVGAMFPVAILVLVFRSRAWFDPAGWPEFRALPGRAAVAVRNRIRRDRGEAGVGHLAVVVLLGAIVAMLMNSGIPGRLTGAAQSALCEVTGERCEGRAASGAPPPAAAGGPVGSSPAPDAGSAPGSDSYITRQAARQPRISADRGGITPGENYAEPLRCPEWAQRACDLGQGLWLGVGDAGNGIVDQVDDLACSVYIRCGPARFRETWEGWRDLFTTNPLETARAIWDESTTDIRKDWNEGRDARAAGRALPLVLGSVFGGRRLFLPDIGGNPRGSRSAAEAEAEGAGDSPGRSEPARPRLEHVPLPTAAAPFQAQALIGLLAGVLVEAEEAARRAAEILAEARRGYPAGSDELRQIESDATQAARIARLAKALNAIGALRSSEYELLRQHAVNVEIVQPGDPEWASTTATGYDAGRNTLVLRKESDGRSESEVFRDFVRYKLPNLELLQRKVSSVEPLDTLGVNAAFLVRFEEGGMGVYKPIEGEHAKVDRSIPQGELARREVAAFQVDRMFGFGLVPTTRLWKGPRGVGSLQEYVESAPHGRPAGEYQPPEQDRMAALDYIIGNTDRHRKNYLTAPGGRLVAIDHGYSFSEESSTDWIQSDFVLEALDRPLSPEVLARIRSVDPAEFGRTLRGSDLSQDAIDGALARLEEVRRHGMITGEAWKGRIFDSEGVLQRQALPQSGVVSRFGHVSPSAATGRIAGVAA